MEEKIPKYLKRESDLSQLRHLESMVLTILTGVFSIGGIYLALERSFSLLSYIVFLAVLFSSIFSLVLFTLSLITRNEEKRIDNLAFLIYINAIIWISFLLVLFIHLIIVVIPYNNIPIILKILIGILVILLLLFFIYGHILIKKHLKIRLKSLYEKEIEGGLRCEIPNKLFNLLIPKIDKYNVEFGFFILSYSLFVLIYYIWTKPTSITFICNPLSILLAFIISLLIHIVLKKLE